MVFLFHKLLLLDLLGLFTYFIILDLLGLFTYFIIFFFFYTMSLLSFFEDVHHYLSERFL